MTDQPVYERVTEYVVSVAPPDHDDRFHWEITVQWRRDELWAVTRHGRCLNAGGKWEYESSPSNRDNDFLSRTRFDLRTALRMAREAAPKLRTNRLTFAEWEQRWSDSPLTT